MKLGLGAVLLAVVEIVDPDLPQKFQQAAATGDGPDIVMWAHDRFGEWAGGGLIAPVDPSDDWAAGILPSAMGALQFDGKTWGYPLSVEAVTLIYNKDNSHGGRRLCLPEGRRCL